MLPIKPQDVLNAAEFRVSLSVFIPEIQAGLVEGKRSAIGATMSCLKSVCELADAPPHHLGSKTYVIKRGDVIYGVQICKSELKVNGKRQMLCGLQTLRTPNFARALKGVDGWKRIGPGLMIIPPLRKEPKLSMNLTHPVDELGCTQQ